MVFGQNDAVTFPLPMARSITICTDDNMEHMVPGIWHETNSTLEMDTILACRSLHGMVVLRGREPLL